MTAARAQALSALAVANENRLARSRTKHELFEGTLSIADALGRECCRSMRVWDLLAAQYRWGPQRVSRLFRLLEYRHGVLISPTRRVDALTARERQALEQTVSA